MVPETGEPQSKENKQLDSTGGNVRPIDRKRISAAPPAPVEQVPTKSGDGEGGFMPLSQLLKCLLIARATPAAWLAHDQLKASKSP
jgi:hypothetical protein